MKKSKLTCDNRNYWCDKLEKNCEACEQYRKMQDNKRYD